MTWIVEAVLVGNHGAYETAELQQCVPVTAVASQARRSGPSGAGPCAPTSRHRGTSTPNALQSELPQTDPAARTANARTLNGQAKMRDVVHDCG